MATSTKGLLFEQRRNIELSALSLIRLLALKAGIDSKRYKTLLNIHSEIDQWFMKHCQVKNKGAINFSEKEENHFYDLYRTYTRLLEKKHFFGKKEKEESGRIN